MRVALNCYPPSTPTGLGTLCRTLLNLFPDLEYIQGNHPRFSPYRSAKANEPKLEDIDVLVCIERCIPESLFRKAKALGKRTVLIVMHEWLSPSCSWFEHTDLFLAPNTRCLDELKALGAAPAALVRLPMDLTGLDFRERSMSKKFVFSNGWGGVHDRKGWPEMHEAIEMIDESYRDCIYIASQKPLSGLMGSTIPKGAISLASSANGFDLYKDMDIAVVPSRIEGLGLAILEPMALGLPVLSTNAPPMNEYIKDAYGSMAELCLIQVGAVTSRVNVGKQVLAHHCRPEDIVRSIRSAKTWDWQTTAELSRRGRRYVEDCLGSGAASRLWGAIANGAH